MFVKLFNQEHAEALQEVGFSASEIADYMGCSKAWVYSRITSKVNKKKQHDLMTHVVDQYDKKYHKQNILSCIECGIDYSKDRDGSNDLFCSERCNAKHVLEDSMFIEIYGDE